MSKRTLESYFRPIPAKIVKKKNGAAYSDDEPVAINNADSTTKLSNGHNTAIQNNNPEIEPEIILVEVERETNLVENERAVVIPLEIEREIVPVGI